jgi:hypothetical protein
MLQVQFVHDIADHAGEEFALNDGEKFVVGLPEFWLCHRARIFLIPGRLYAVVVLSAPWQRDETSRMSRLTSNRIQKTDATH